MIRVVVAREDFAEFVNFLQKHRVSLGKIFVTEMDDFENWVGIMIEDESGKIAKFDKREILALRQKNFTYKKIAEKIGCSKSYVEKVCKAKQ